MRVAGIILAAGSSSRMGRTKQLLPYRNQTVIECVVDSALKSRLCTVVVVLGHQADKLDSLLSKRNVTLVHNYTYKNGQSTSIQAGLMAVRDQVDAVLYLLGDQPLIVPETIDCIIAAYEKSCAPIVQPVFNGRRGNPVLFDRQTFADIDSLSGDTGCRVLFPKYIDRIDEVHLNDHSVLLDIDTEQDYQMLKKLE